MVRVEYHCGIVQLAEQGQHPLTGANVFLETVAVRGLSEATVCAYAYDLVTVIRWLEESGQTLEKITPTDLVAFLQSQRDVGAHPNSINRRLTTFRLWHRFVVGTELGESSGVSLPAPHYKGRGRGYLGLHSRGKRSRELQVKIPKTVVEPLERPQVRAFFQSLNRYRDLGIVYLMLFCGLRSREILSLRTADVGVFDRRLLVHGKGNHERVLPMSANLLRVLSDYVRLEQPSRTIGDHFFVVLQGKRRGHPMTRAGLRSLFRYRRERRANTLANANAHRFRHTFGTDMARSGVRLPVLQRLMGHADAKTTLQYIHLSMADVAAEYHRAIAIIEKRYEQE